MGTEFKLTYLVHLRWYAAANYCIVLLEQFAFWYFSPHWFFWFMLGANIIVMYALANKINKLEKEIVLS